jgi:enoyl-CoA hydratase
LDEEVDKKWKLMKFKYVIYEKNKGVATITLNRPEALNAFSKEVVEEILQTLEDVKTDETIRVVVLTGVGEKAFSAGADIKAMSGMTALKARELSLMGEELCNSLENQWLRVGRGFGSCHVVRSPNCF